MPILPCLARRASAYGPDAATTKCRDNGVDHVASSKSDLEWTGAEPESASPPSRSKHEAHKGWQAHCTQPTYATASSTELDCTSTGNMLAPVHTSDGAAIPITCGLWLAGCSAIVTMAGARRTLLEGLHTVRRTIASQDTVTADAKLAVPSHV
jgi:hypothetical protein